MLRPGSLRTTAGILLLLGLLVAMALRYWSFTMDDAYIFYRYADNLAHGHGPVYNPGEQVEGYTSFLWLLLLTPFAALGVDPVPASKALGILAMGGTLIATFYLGRLVAERTSAWLWLAPLALAVSGPVTLWSVGGLEAPLFTALLSWAVYLFLREEAGTLKGPWSALLFGLLAWARPEGLALFAVTAAYRVAIRIYRRERRTTDIAWLGIWLALVVPYEVWRLVYYGHLFPNTFYAKAGGSLTERLREGWQYLTGYRDSLGGTYLLLFPLLFWLAKGFSQATLYIALLIASQVAMVLYEGGDWMPMFRFLLPVTPLLFLLVQEGFRHMTSALPVPGTVGAGVWQAARRRALPLLVVAGLFLLFPAVNLRWNLSSGDTSHGFQIKVEREGLPRAHIATGRWLRDNADPGDTVVISDAGALAYYSRLRAIDVSALSDPFIAERRYRFGDAIFSDSGSQDVERARAEIRSYILDQKPRWIVYVSYRREGEGFDITAAQKHWYRLYLDPRFPEDYRLVRSYTHYETVPGSGYYLLIYERLPAPG